MAKLTEHFSLRTLAENASAMASSAFCYDLRKDIRVSPIVMSKRKLRKTQRQILFANGVVVADYPSFEQAPERFNIVRMNIPSDIFLFAVGNHVMRKSELSLREQFTQILIASMFIGSYQGYLVAYGLFHKVLQGVLIGSLDHLADDVAFTSDSSDNSHLIASACGMGFFIPVAV